MSLLAILLFIGTMALSLWATMRVRQVYGEFSQFPASSGLSGAEIAATILRQEGIYDVEIVEHDEMLGDHYDPIQKRLVLSRDNFHGTSTATLGVAAHECGHAIQHKQADAPLQWRMASSAAWHPTVEHRRRIAVEALGFARKEPEETGGRPAERWFAIN